jgi:hypothetical protein
VIEQAVGPDDKDQRPGDPSWNVTSTPWSFFKRPDRVSRTGTDILPAGLMDDLGQLAAHDLDMVLLTGPFRSKPAAIDSGRVRLG